MRGKARAAALLLFLPVAFGLLAGRGPEDERRSPSQLAREIVQKAGVKGGLVVHLGCGDGRLTAALCAGDSFLVHGLDRSPANVARAREYIKRLGLYGKRVSVELWRGEGLPYADNLVNLVVVEEGVDVPAEEILRVLAPHGVAIFRKGGRLKRIVKPWPREIDEWTHYLHDSSNNAVAKDFAVGPPRHLQWVAGPLYCRSHEYNSSVSALVSANGRIFYILDEGPRGITPSSDPRVPDRWALVCRDAFSGVLLWKRPIEGWGWKEWRAKGLWSTPMTLPRRLVAVGERVYVTLGYRAPLSELDAATGKVLRTFEETAHTDEVLYHGGLLVLRVRRIPKPGEKPKGPEFVVALDPKSGRILWRVPSERIVPLTLAASDGRVCFHNFEEIVCLDLGTGRELWRAKSPAPRGPRGTAGTLVIYKDVVLYTSARGLQAFSLESGEKLWTGPRMRGFGATQPPDLIVAGGLVWCPVRRPKISVPPSDTLEIPRKPLAVEAWVLSDTGNGVVVAKGGTAHGFSLFVKNWRPGFAVRVDGKMRVVWAKRRLERGRWTHLAGVLTEGGRLLILVDGEVSGEAKAGGLISGEPAEDEVFIGGEEGGNVGPYRTPFNFEGLIDEVRLYLGPVRAEEVAEHYRDPSRVAAEKASLVLRFSFDDGEATDLSGHGNHGRIEGAKPVKGKFGLAMQFRVTPFERRGTAVALDGRNPHTGEVVRTVFVPCLISPKHHFRCYRSKATERFFLLPKRGVEFLDLTNGLHMRHDWLRGACSYGFMPANGLLYMPPHQCFCYPGVKLAGFLALAHKRSKPAGREPNPLERGPAYGKVEPVKASPDDWPMYRHDPERSGHVPSEVPTSLSRLWEAKLGGELTAPIEARGRVYVARSDNHTVYCLDAETGRVLWEYTAGGRVDSPPTFYRGLLLFGSSDGWVYCLRARDGKLAWRFRAAPEERKVVAFGQIESAWPVHGSVLVLNDVAYLAAGRSTFLDGGIYLYGLDPWTGRVLHKAHVEGPWPDVQKEEGRPFDMEGARSDILVTDRERKHLYMFQLVFDLDLRPVEAPRITPLGARKTGLHLLATGGFLQKEWWDRTYWMYARLWPGYYFAYDAPKAGQILVFDETTTYGLKVFRRRPRGFLSPVFAPGEGYELFADENDNEPYLDPKVVGWEKGPGYSRREPPKWSVNIPVRARALVLAGDTLFLCGPPDEMPPQDPLLHIEGRDGAVLWAVSARDGKKLAELRLDEAPVFDGLIAARGRLLLSTKDGKVFCLGGTRPAAGG